MGNLPEPVILSSHKSIFNQYLAEMRDAEIQQDRMRFRLNLARASEILAYEISKHLMYESREVTSPLGTCEMDLPKNWPVLIAIMRAGLGMLDGFSRMFDHSDQAFVSAYRRYINSEDFVVNVEYTSIPDIEERTIIILDPMIATGRSIVRCWEAIQREGAPKRVFVAAVIASEEGIETVQRRLPEADIFVGAVDAELTAKAYIIPGLGDAGDLAYGEKAR